MFHAESSATCDEAPLSMIQFNLEAVVPFFVSSENYALLWDNYAWTYLNPPDKDALVAWTEGCPHHANLGVCIRHVQKVPHSPCCCGGL